MPEVITDADFHIAQQLRYVHCGHRQVNMATAAAQINENRAALDASSPVPLYHQLRQALEASWRNRFGPDDELPTEHEIIAQFGVSRITVRRALDDMIADGVIHRPRARGRLQWAPLKVKQQINRLRGFFADDALASGHHPSTRVLEFAQGSWPQATRFLGLAEGAQCYRISRLHESDGTPLSHQVSWIPCSVCPAVSLGDLSGSLLQMLENRCGVTVAHAEQRLIAREGTANEIALLQLPPRSHVFEIDRVSYGPDGTAVEYFVSILDITRYEFLSSMDATPGARGKPRRSPFSGGA
jgi:GntR family transcriptional regulator